MTERGPTMLNLNSIMIGSADPKALAEFYRKVLDKKPDWQDGEWTGFAIGACTLTVAPHDKVKGKTKEPERIMLNFETSDVKGEFERIKALGVTVIAEPYNPDPNGEGEMWIATLADPDGNYFQLTTPWGGTTN